LDTRTKIISAERVAELARSGAYLVSGSFDPLVADLAEQLAALKAQGPQEGGPLVVFIRSTENPILPVAARAELLAALSVVDFVCYEACDLAPAVQLEQEHAVRLNDLIAHVHARQSAASNASSSQPSSQGSGKSFQGSVKDR
jgi:hypothetical protein